MRKPARNLLVIIGVVILLIVIAITAIPLFINADTFRAKIESSMSQSLGRKVTIGQVHLSIWSGGLTAEDVKIADDPQFSNEPFMQASSVKIGVDLLPLIISKQLHIRGFTLQSPKIQLLRSSDGTWNYASMSQSAKGEQPRKAETKSQFPDLTVGHIDVANGQVKVVEEPLKGTHAQTETHMYQNVDLSVSNFGFKKGFPFKASASLPGNGSVDVNGTAGPVNPNDASSTPFSGHLELKNVDPVAAGLVDASSGISGSLGDVVLDANWTGERMHVSKLTVSGPKVIITPVPNAPKQEEKAATSTKPSVLQTLTVDSADVKNGTLTLQPGSQGGQPGVYQQINAQISDISPSGAAPFKVSAQTPGGGNLTANGKAGPFDQPGMPASPIDAAVTLNGVNLATAGVLPADAGIGGKLNLQAQVRSDGKSLQATGKGQVAGIKLAKDGTPSPKPLETQFTVNENEATKSGQIQNTTISVGGATVNLSGGFGTSGPSTSLDMKAVANAVSVDAIEAFLPALGVHLPQGSQLKGGTVTTNLAITGTTASPVISGPVKLENSQLAGFNLGQQLQALSAITGGRIGGATGSTTTIKSLSMNVHQTSAGLRTDNVDLQVTGLGTATGSGTVAANGALNYNTVVKLTALTGKSAAPAQQTQSQAGGVAGAVAGLLGGSGGSAGGIVGGLTGRVLDRGIPVAIGGTTSHPTFTPNVAGLAQEVGASAAQRALQGKQTPAKGQQNGNQLQKALGGLLGH